jgi:hypothetical protein
VNPGGAIPPKRKETSRHDEQDERQVRYHYEVREKAVGHDVILEEL